MASTSERGDRVDYVFGYATLVGLRERLRVGDVKLAPLPGRLRGFHRTWGVAMDNWDAVNDPKHFVDRKTGGRPQVRVAYLDIYERQGSTVNGLALPVDATRLVALDAREVNYERIDVSEAFEHVEDVSAGEREDADAPAGGAGGMRASPRRVFAYVGTEAARERCRAGAAEGNVCVSADYVATVRRAFERFTPDALAEYERSTNPLPFPERDLQRVSRRVMH